MKRASIISKEGKPELERAVHVLAGWLAGRLVLVTDVVGDLIDKQEIDDAAAKRILDMAMAS